MSRDANAPDTISDPRLSSGLVRTNVARLTLWATLFAGLHGCSDDVSVGLVTPAIDNGVFFPDEAIGSSGEETVVFFPHAVQSCAPGEDHFALDAVSVATLGTVGQTVYAWIPEEEARSLTAESNPLGTAIDPGETLTTAAPNALAGARAVFGETLGASGRIAWPHPWATRLIGESQDSPRLLRLSMRSDARWVVVDDGAFHVVDAAGNRLENEVAAAQPELIAGVFLAAAELAAGDCSARYPRAMVVTNAAAVERWALGSESELARVEADASKVEQLLIDVRECPVAADETWTSSVVCSKYAGTEGPLAGYESALSIAGRGYWPQASDLARLADALRGDLRSWASSPLAVVSAIPSEPDTETSSTETSSTDAASADTGMGTNATASGETSEPLDGATTVTGEEHAADASVADASMADDESGTDATSVANSSLTSGDGGAP